MRPADQSSSMIIAQCESFAGKMPAFYGAIIACMLAQVIVIQHQAPFLVGIAAPLAIAVVATIRMIWWLERRKRPFTEAQARASLQRSKTILIASTFTIIVLDFVAYRYVDDQSKAFLTLELLGCTMTGVYCLMHLRSTAHVMVAALMLSIIYTSISLPPTLAVGTLVATTALMAAMVHGMRGYHGDFVSLMQATGEARKLSNENMRLANLDMLTELPNRRQFFKDLEALAAEARADGRRIAIAIADLDGFKPINDTHGHMVGDRVLRTVGARIAAAPGFRSYRLGGDEFALIMREAEDDNRLVDMAETLISQIRQPLELGEIIVGTGCSVGIATFPDLATTPELLYERADYALYHAKRSGRNRALLFTHEHEAQLRSQSEIEQALRSADLSSEFHLVYQPIVRASDGKSLGFECLARWNSPLLGSVSPALFIPVAEQSGLIASLTPHLLRQALQAAATWPSDQRLSFNLSPHDVASSERTLAIIGIIGQSGVSPSRIDLELTETALVNNFDEACANMAALKRIGVHMSLDDFGTGYSSLSHVHILPLDKIKIDQSFVRNLNAGDTGRTIVRSVMSLCRDLRLSCVVEGVETTDQLNALSEMGCEQVQGYLFARPMPATDVASYLAVQGGGMPVAAA